MMMMTPNELLQEVGQTLLPHDDKIPSIPDRMYFRIGDVAEIAGVQPYVLRFWEKEFDFLAPIKNASGQRLYRKGDVESVLLIKRLLYLERYSIEGAKKRIKELRKQGSLGSAKKERAVLDDFKLECIQKAKEDLRALIELVS
jgi:DNA-binding transcriptional MerR regulator